MLFSLFPYFGAFLRVSCLVVRRMGVVVVNDWTQDGCVNGFD